MKTVKIRDKHNMHSVEIYEAETIEEKVRRIVDEKEPIEDGAPIIFQPRSEGVRPEFDIRTDRWAVAIAAMDKVSADQLSQYTKKQDKPKVEETKDIKMEPDATESASKEPAA